jgi:hypothetical protein
MFASFSRSWNYTKISFGILGQNKSLLIFPILSGIASVLVLTSFLVPLWLTGALEAWSSSGEGGNAAEYVTLFLFYFCNYFVILFFNSALMFGVFRALAGQPAGVGMALGDATKVLPQILGWAAISAVVGVILNTLEKHKTIGRIVSGLLGSAWTALTYFVLPVMIVEKMGPIDAFKRSVEILKTNWGTALIGNFSLGLIGFLIVLPLLIIGGFLVVGGLAAGGIAGMVAGFIAGGALIMLGAAVNSALGNVFRAVLFSHSTGMALPASVDTSALNQAFVSKG